MPTDISVVIADSTRMPAIRDGLRLPVRAVYFTSGNLASALDGIRTNQPKLVAVDAVFAQTPQGLAFLDRVEKTALVEADIRLIVKIEGRWVTAPRDGAPAAVKISAPIVVPVPKPVVVAAPVPNVVAAVVAAEPPPASTRRAPRFLVRDPLNAVVENGSASLVDISVLGAQIVSQPMLRPNQKIRLALPDMGETLHVTALVAWSTFEMSKLVAKAHYRAGIEFTGAAQQALEDYRRRHCAEELIPYRGRAMPALNL
jgi:hypothetical protein